MTAQIDCPRCRKAIPLEDVSVSTDIALCRGCGESWKYSELLERREAGAVVSAPPRGAWYVPGMNGFEVGASTRSPIALFLVPFMCVWSGFSLTGIYGTQIRAGEFNLLASLFGIPFLLGTVLMGSVAVMAVCGKVVVTVRGDDASVFAGVGALGRRRTFKWSQVSGISTIWNYGRQGQANPQIVIEADRQIKLYTLNAARQRFVMTVLNMHRKM